MSYRKMMKHRPHKMQYCGFNVLEANQRRKSPWLGGGWFEDGMDAKRKQFVEEWHEETARLLKENPFLELVN